MTTNHYKKRINKYINKYKYIYKKEIKDSGEHYCKLHFQRQEEKKLRTP